jgi:hypothetical protein
VSFHKVNLLIYVTSSSQSCFLCIPAIKFKTTRWQSVDAADAATREGDGQRRLTQTGTSLLTTRIFTHCRLQGYSPEECQAYITQQIEDAGGHELGDVMIEIHVPRNPDVMADTYWMVEVPVNIHGKFACDRNGGQIEYPFEWATPSDSDGDLNVKNVDCQGLSAGECCLAIRKYGQEAISNGGLGGYDVNGHCLACFAHQEFLIPVRNDASEVTDYLDHALEASECVKDQLTSTEVVAADAITDDKIGNAIAALAEFADPHFPPSCSDFELLLKTLYDAAVLASPLSMNIGELACNYCYGENDREVTELGPTHPLIEQLLILLNSEVRSSIMPCVIIYTNENGEIVADPNMGGSRSDLRYEEEFENSGFEDGLKGWSIEAVNDKIEGRAGTRCRNEFLATDSVMEGDCYAFVAATNILKRSFKIEPNDQEFNCLSFYYRFVSVGGGRRGKKEDYMTVAVNNQDSGEIMFTETVASISTRWIKANLEIPVVAHTAMIMDFEGLSFNKNGDRHDSELHLDGFSVIDRPCSAV